MLVPMVGRLKSSVLHVLSVSALNPRAAMLAIFLLSFAVRASLLVLYLHSGNVLYTGEADSIARSLAAKGAFADPFAAPTGATAHCAPIYPAVGALIYTIF